MSEKKIGPYTVIQTLGRGGMGAVYLATGPDGAPVAVKTLATTVVPDAAALARFGQEAEILSRLDHPHIVRALGPLARNGECHYFPMEFVPGKSLAEVLREVGRLDVGRAVQVLRQVAAGLDAAHRQGIVHRDLKPSNLLITQRDVVKIADFGVARALDLTRLTLTGALVGTPAYLAPELIAGGEPDARSDLYALGVVAYEVLTGRLPFAAEQPLALLRQHVHEPPVPLEAVDPGLPELLRNIVHRCLEKEPARRYESAAALLADLECVHVAPPDAALSERIQTFVARETIRVEARLAQTHGSHRWRRVTLASLGALLIVLCLVIAVAWRHYYPVRPGDGGETPPLPGGGPVRSAPVTLVLRDGTVLHGAKVGFHPVTREVLLTDGAGQVRAFPPEQVEAFYPAGVEPDAAPAAGK